jgi:murein DD-endopeptidase MepM/ murein hydrolase activator NlpD
MAKPDDFLIHLPFEPDTSSHLGYFSYGSPGSAHFGLDYYAIDFDLNGGAIYPIASGTVVWEGDVAPNSYGNVVFVNHDEAGFPGYVSLYAHLDSTNVEQGDVVNITTQLGVEGTSGKQSTQHLHFAMRYCPNIQVGEYPKDKCTDAVVPEPILGENVYEGLGWWHERYEANLTEEDVTAERRPQWDTTQPTGTWGSTAIANESELTINDSVRFDVEYNDNDEIGEVRLTAYYTDWVKSNDLRGFDPTRVWRILARCKPDKATPFSGCRSDGWQWTWDLDDKEVDTTFPGFLEVPWLPKADKPPVDLEDRVDVCISFDIFDRAGNPLYAPGGTQCNFLLNNQTDVGSSDLADNQARLIHILPLSEGTLVQDQSTFISDVTVPDGTVVSPDQTLHKVWRVRNSGTSTWKSGYDLVFVGGDQMGAPSSVNVPGTISPGDNADLTVDMTAPSTPGTYTGRWRLRNAQGTYFGDELWITVEVVGSTDGADSHISVFTADPSSPSNANIVRFHVKVDWWPQFRAMRLRVDDQVVGETSATDYTFEWNTSGTNRGDHTVALEVAEQTDASWTHPERQTMVYTLEGDPTPVNHIPNRPSPSSPHDWYVYYSGNTAHLCAQANGDPDGDAITGYYFDIYDSAQLWNSGWVGSNCVTTDALGPHGYQWRVKVRDSHGAESEWSDTWHFTLVNSNLSIDEMYFEPQDVNSEQVKIRACTSGQGGVGITLRASVNDANDGSNNGQWHIIKELGVPCFNEIDAPVWNTLEYADGPHLVRVEARGNDSSWDGAAVREETYTLPHRRPSHPKQVSPVPESHDLRDPIYLNSRTISFDWEPAIRAGSYTLHVGTSPSPKNDSDPVFRETFDSSVTQHTETFEEDHATLYWQVTASNDKGASSSGDQLFGIDRVDPVCTVQPLSSPTSESVFQVSWNGSDDLSGVRSFDIQYLDSDRGEWNDWLTGVSATKTHELFEGQPGHTYAFRCRATDEANNTGDYPTDADTSTKVDASASSPETSSANLAVLELNSPSNPSDDIVIQAVVQNQGNLDTQNAFYTDLYADHLPTGPGDYTGSVRFWVNDPIGAGATVTLTSILTDLAFLGPPLRTADAASEISSTLYTQVDSTGVVSESDESDNISDGFDVCIASSDDYEDMNESSNWLLNGGFEDGEEAKPAAWSRDAWDSSAVEFIWDHDHAHSGSHSVKIVNTSRNDARWIQNVLVEPKTEYRLSGWIRTENVSHSDEWNDVGANLSLYGTYNHTEAMLGSNDWTYVSTTFNTGDDTEVTIAARLGHWGGTTTGTAWFDDLRVEPLDDSVSGDDIPTNASLITLDETQHRNFDTLADEDWAKMRVSGGMTYTIRTGNLGSRADTYLYLYDTDGSTLLASNDDYRGSLGSRIDWTAPVTGTYYLLVKHWNPNVGGCGTIYDLSLSKASVSEIYIPIVSRG